MVNQLKKTLKEKTYIQLLFIFQIVFVLAYKMFVEIGVPYSIRYLTYVLLSLIVVYWIKDIRIEELKPMRWTGIILCLWLVEMLISAFVNGFSFSLATWASVNWLKGFVFMAACLVYLKKDDYELLIRIMKGLYVVNVIIAIIQYIMGYEQDHLGGVFGTDFGCNGAMNTYMCALLIILLTDAFEEKRWSKFTGFFLISCLSISGFAEIKLFFYEYVFIVVCITLYYVWKKQANMSIIKNIILFSIIGWIIGLIGMFLVSPRSFLILVGKRDYSDYVGTSRTYYKISRLNAIQEINDLFFKNDLKKLFIGLGLGNCETSGFSFFVSDFFKKYWEYNYYWCSHHLLFLEGGLIGLGLYGLVFAQMALNGFVTCIKSKSTKPYAVLLVLFSAVTAFGLIYNNDMRKEYAYFTCLILAYGMKYQKENYDLQR